MPGRGKPIKEAKLTPVYLAQAWHEDAYGGLVTVLYPHHEVHEGEMWYLDMFSGSVADNGSIILAGVMPVTHEQHFTMAGACGGHATIELIEGAAFSASGSAMLPYNMNRNIGDAGALPVRGNPTLVGGTVLQTMFLPGGSGPKAGGGHQGTRDGLEWITNPGESYAVRLTNVSGGAQDAWLGINFYNEEV